MYRLRNPIRATRVGAAAWPHHTTCDGRRGRHLFLPCPVVLVILNSCVALGWAASVAAGRTAPAQTTALKGPSWQITPRPGSQSWPSYSTFLVSGPPLSPLALTCHGDLRPWEMVATIGSTLTLGRFMDAATVHESDRFVRYLVATLFFSFSTCPSASGAAPAAGRFSEGTMASLRQEPPRGLFRPPRCRRRRSRRDIPATCWP
jgi:hypothetical protein